MKTQYKLSVIISILILLSGCSTDEFEKQESMKAAINATCSSSINYSGVDIYYDYSDQGYGLFMLQLGGHSSNSSDLPDLGINLFAPNSDGDFTSGDFEISNNWSPGKALVYYFDNNGNEYYSKNNQGYANVSISFTSDGKIKLIVVVFNNVEVYNATLDDTKCINKFSYSSNKLLNLVP